MFSICIPAGDPDGDFHLHPSSGALSSSRGLDRETRAEYTLEVVAVDRGSPALSTTVTVEIKVLDVNDNSPVFSKSSYSVEVSEDAAEGSKVLQVNLDNQKNRICAFFDPLIYFSLHYDKPHYSLRINNNIFSMSRCQL